MLFAAAYASRACPHCGSEYARTISASLIFFLILIGVGSAVLAPAMTTRVGTGVVTWGLALVASAALLVAVATATDALIRSWTPLPDECPRCGADMIRARSVLQELDTRPPYSALSDRTGTTVGS